VSGLRAEAAMTVVRIRCLDCEADPFFPLAIEALPNGVAA
jgi:hypothetical protein